MSLSIKNCGKLFKFLCPQTWDELKVTEDWDVRFCSVCQKNVHYCYSLEDIQRHKGDCIVVHINESTGVEIDQPEYLGEAAD